MTQHTDTSPIVGIDLGTTNSLAAIVTQDGPRVLTDLTPSVVRYSSDQDPVVGDDALARIHEFPRRTVNSAKRLMGRSRADVGDDLGYLGYKVVEGEHDTARIGLTLEDGSARVVSPQEVSADILRAVASRASESLGEPVTRAVVTVPAYFDDAQRQATRDAGRLAGIDVVRIVNEPTAAALAYGIGTTKPTEPKTIAVFDLGGGTFDVSILSLVPSDQDNPTDFFRVLSTSGDTRLGGDDVDHTLMDLFAREIEAQLGVALDLKGDTLDPGVRRSLAAFARGVKHELSDNEHADVRIDLGSGRVYERRVSRGELESLIAPLLERAKLACERAIKDAKLSAKIDALVLVGGSTRIPAVRAAAGDIFGVEPYTALDPDRVVAIGAAVQASIISGDTQGSLLLDVIPLSLGIETAGGAVAKLIMRNSTVPTRATERFSTNVDGQVNIKLNVVQGEREMVEDCRSLGVFELRGIPPMPAGVPKLVVEFVVDANGVLDVRAVEERSGKRAQIQIVPNHGLTEEEIRRIEEDSLTHAKDDMTRHRIADLITNASLDVKWISERLAKHGGALDGDARAALESKLDEVRTHIRDASADHTSVDPNVFHAAKEALDQASIPLQEASIAASLRADQPR